MACDRVRAPSNGRVDTGFVRHDRHEKVDLVASEEECFFERRRCAPASYRLGKNAANRRRTQQRCPLGTAGVVRYFFRVFRVEAYGISVTRIFFFFVLILSLIQNNRRFHVFDRRARSIFRESPRPDRTRDGFETETRVGIGLNQCRSNARLAVKTVRLGSGGFFLSRPRRARRQTSPEREYREGRETDAFRRL